MRKDESIERTFKGVAKHFREVFSELVQGGLGFLVIVKKKVCYVLFCMILFMDLAYELILIAYVFRRNGSIYAILTNTSER